MLYAGDILWNGKSFFKEAIKKGMKLDQVITVLLNITCQLDKGFKFDCINLKEIGLDKCNFHEMSPADRMCTLINTILNSEKTLAKSFANLEKFVNQTLKTPGTGTGNTAFTDQFVKASATDTTAGTLDQKIKSSQPGTLTYNPTDLTFTGFVPIYGCIMIDKAGINKFESTGLGKVNSDCWCYAISDGRNGTVNRMGRFPRWASAITDIGNTGGNKNFTVKISNIETFNIQVTGSIGASQYSGAPVVNADSSQAQGNQMGNIGIYDNLIPPNSQFGNVQLPVTNLDHTHDHNLVIDHTNVNVAAIDLLPLYIDEIPIVRIK